MTDAVKRSFTCKTCSITTIRHRNDDSGLFFCSDECLIVYLATNPVRFINCQQCGGKFEAKSTSSKFCSSACYSESLIRRQ